MTSSLATIEGACTGDKGLEIAPGKDVEENEELNVVGNAYNAVPKAKKWIPVDPRPGCITVSGLQHWSVAGICVDMLVMHAWCATSRSQWILVLVNHNCKPPSAAELYS